MRKSVHLFIGLCKFVLLVKSRSVIKMPLFFDISRVLQMEWLRSLNESLSKVLAKGDFSVNL